MTRPYLDPAQHACSRAWFEQQGLRSQVEQCPRWGGGKPVYMKSVSRSYSASMASMIGHHGPPALSGGAPTKKCHSHDRKGGNSHNCPPVSTSHLLAVNLEEVYPTSTCKDSRSLFDGLVGAIERHILHSDPSGNVKIPSSLLHIGECPDVPEHLATFALRRSGSLHFRQRRDEAAEEEEEVSRGVKHRHLLGHHSTSEPKLSTCAKMEPEVATAATCSDLSSLSQTSSAGSVGSSSLTSPGGTPRAGGLRRTFSWHRIKDKLRR
ncbi:hypothetical protein Efla_000382 [Eimeria flavescens]